MRKGTVATVVIGTGIAAILIAGAVKGAPPLYCCPYCEECFPSLAELAAHVEEIHPNERIPVDIIWT